MDRTITYPVLEGKIAERGIRKKTIAEALNITPRALGNKLNGKTEFSWSEVVELQSRYFQDVTKDDLMRRAGA